MEAKGDYPTLTPQDLNSLLNAISSTSLSPLSTSLPQSLSQASEERMLRIMQRLPEQLFGSGNIGRTVIVNVDVGGLNPILSGWH